VAAVLASIVRRSGGGDGGAGLTLTGGGCGPLAGGCTSLVGAAGGSTVAAPGSGAVEGSGAAGGTTVTDVSDGACGAAVADGACGAAVAGAPGVTSFDDGGGALGSGSPSGFVLGDVVLKGAPPVWARTPLARQTVNTPAATHESVLISTLPLVLDMSIAATPAKRTSRRSQPPRHARAGFFAVFRCFLRRRPIRTRLALAATVACTLHLDRPLAALAALAALAIGASGLGCGGGGAPSGPAVVFDACQPLALAADPAATAAETAGVAAGIALWNLAAGTHLTLAPGADPVSAPTLPIHFQPAAPPFHGLYDAPDAQIFINDDLTDHQLAVTVAHEVGHSFGLVHVTDQPSVMNPANLMIEPQAVDISTLVTRWGPCQ
jgi:hypothetical protein